MKELTVLLENFIENNKNNASGKIEKNYHYMEFVELDNKKVYFADDAQQTLYAQSLKEEVKKWPDNVFQYVYENSQTYQLIVLMKEQESIYRYLTSEDIISVLTPQNLRKSIKALSSEDLMVKFFKVLLNRPTWNDEIVRNYLEKVKKPKVSNALFSQYNSDIYEIENSGLISFQINYHLLPAPHNSTSGSSHLPSDINTHLLEMIKSFVIVNPEESPITGIFVEPSTPRNGIKTIHITACDNLYAKAFSNVFFDLLKSNLLNSEYVKKSDTHINYESIIEMLEHTEKLVFTHKLENSLVNKTSIKQKKI